jgi:hypothetical protein
MLERLDRRRFLTAGGAAAFFGLAAPGALAELLQPAPRFTSLPGFDPPVVHVVTAPAGTAPGYIFIANTNGAGQPGPMIIDDDGELVWFRPRPGLTVMNFSAHLLDGKPVIAWWEGQSQGGHGSGEYVLLGPDYREVGRVGAGNGLTADFHEFSITPRGSAILTAYAASPDGKLLDSVVQEVDVDSGRVLLEWRASDHIGLGESYALQPATGPFDFAHLNAAAVDRDGNLLVSSRHAWTVFKVDRSTGEVIWRLGGKKSDFALDDGASFAWQHHARRHRDGALTVFDNGAGPVDSEAFSRGLKLRLDEQAGTATLEQQLAHPDRFLASAMGSMEVLDDGGAFVGWGSVPRFSEFSSDGTIRFDAGYPGGGFTYRAFRRAWSGLPTDPPALAVARFAGRPAAFATWNGATGVAHWRLLSGQAKNALARGPVVAKRSFETRLPVAPHAGWAAAEALDARGRVLGRTAAVAV